MVGAASERHYVMQAEAIELRNAFAAFLGDERFRKFVATGWRRGQLRFWQQQEWDRFCVARPDLKTSLEELQVALRVCELHGDELQPDEVALFPGCIDYAKEYIETRSRLFPHAATAPISTEGVPMEGDRIAVWYCPSCRRAEEKWSARRSRPPA
jgi:hypothetical protein